MRTETQTGSNIFLTGIILLANLDFTGLIEYGVKAMIGGGIWLGYKLTADWMAQRKKTRKPPKRSKGKNS